MTRASDVDPAFVEAKRQARVGWASIARMAGCAEADLRRRFDPAALGMAALPSRPKAQHEVVREFLLSAGLCSDDAQILTRMWRANGARQSSAQLAAGIAGGGAAIDACKEARNSGRRRLGLPFAVSGFALAPEGVDRLSRLAGLRPWPPGANLGVSPPGPAAPNGAGPADRAASRTRPGWDEVVGGLRALGLGRDESVIIARLWRADGGFVATEALFRDLGPAVGWTALLGRALTKVLAHGVAAVGGRKKGWRLTRPNVARVEALAARREADG